jgi:hypothetical protein
LVSNRRAGAGLIFAAPPPARARRRCRPRGRCGAPPAACPRRDEPNGGRLAGRRGLCNADELGEVSGRWRSSAAAVARRRPERTGRRDSPGHGEAPAGVRWAAMRRRRRTDANGMRRRAGGRDARRRSCSAHGRRSGVTGGAWAAAATGVEWPAGAGAAAGAGRRRAQATGVEADGRS